MISHLNATGRGLRAFADNIGLAGACEVDIACLDPALQQQLSLGDQRGRADDGDDRGQHLSVLGHAAQRFAQFVHAVFPDGRTIASRILEDPAAGRGTRGGVGRHDQHLLVLPGGHLRQPRHAGLRARGRRREAARAQRRLRLGAGAAERRRRRRAPRSPPGTPKGRSPSARPPMPSTIRAATSRN